MKEIWGERHSERKKERERIKWRQIDSEREREGDKYTASEKERGRVHYVVDVYGSPQLVSV